MKRILLIWNNTNLIFIVAQKMEDDIHISTSSKQKHFFGLRKKKSGTGGNGSASGKNSSAAAAAAAAADSRSSTLTSLQNSERPQSPCDLDISSENVISSGSLRAMEHLSTSNPSIGKDSKMKSPTLELEPKLHKRYF